MGKAYELKEEFFNIWNVKSRDEALEQYSRWKGKIPSEIEEHYNIANFPIFAKFNKKEYDY